MSRPEEKLRALFVDDEINVLRGYSRSLRAEVKLDVAACAEEALDLMASRPPYPVIVSDMRMPGTNGLELLQEVKKRAPDTVRIMLTGNNDQQTAIDAINEGDVFRFLTKPCAPETLVRAIRAGAEQHRLIRAERELLEGTLAGTVRVLGDTLSLINADAFGSVTRKERLIYAVAKQMGIKHNWHLNVLATLCQIGWVVVPPGVLDKLGRNEELSAEEQQLFEMHPMVGANLLEKIPRLDAVAKCVKYQMKNFDGSGIPRDELSGSGIPLGARILKVINDYDAITAAGAPSTAALSKLGAQEGKYDPSVLNALESCLQEQQTPAAEQTQMIDIEELREGMVLARDLHTRSRGLLLPKGHVITRSSREHLLAFKRSGQCDDVALIGRPRNT